MNTATKAVLREAMPPLRRFLPAVFFGALSAAAAVGLLLVSGWLIVSASLVDSLVPLSVAVVGVRFFAVSRATFRYLERLAGHDAALRRLAGLRANIVQRLTPLSPAGLGGTDRGRVLSTLVDDVENLQNLSLRVVAPMATGGLVALCAVVAMFFTAPAAGLSLAVCLLLSLALAVGVSWVMGDRAERAISARRAELSGALVDYLTGLDVLLAYGVEEQARQRISDADAELRRTVTSAALAQSVSAAVVSVGAGAASLWALLVAAPGMPGGAADGPWFAVAVLLPMAVFEVFSAVPQAAASWRSVRSSAQRIAAVIPDRLPSEVRADAAEGPVGQDAAEGAARTSDGANTAAGAPALRLRGVAASWPGGATRALTGVDLDLAPGERVLVSGPSGAGKSTLAAVLVGFLNYQGEYSVGGTESRRLAGPALRETVGLCEQSPTLFDEDLRQNLLFARDTASDEELLEMLRRVGLAEWARSRGGLDARVGDRGALVSGGQAQRIALARALLRGFPVLVLDEPTAGVDPAASDALLRDLLGAAGQQSVVLISHVAPPEGTIDRTVLIRDGRTVGESGAGK